MDWPDLSGLGSMIKFVLVVVLIVFVLLIFGKELRPLVELLVASIVSVVNRI